MKIKRRLVAALALGMCLAVSAQVPTDTTPVPAPPPLVPAPIPGQPAPFNPDQTREAQLEPDLNLRWRGLDSLPQGPRLLDLPAAVKLALTQQPDIQTALGQLRQAEGVVVQQRAALLPRIDFSSTFLHSSSPGTGGDEMNSATLVTAGGGGAVVASGGRTNQRLTSNLGLSQLLFDFGRTRMLVLQADLTRQAAAASLLQAENDVALDVKERFYTLLLQRRLVQVREDDLEGRQEQLRLARALYDAGELAPGDVVRAQTAVTNAVVSLNSARRELELARQDQAQALGLPPLSQIEIEESSEPQLPDTTTTYLMTKALERRPDMLVVQKELESGEAALGAAYALNRPALSAFTGITYQGDIDGVQRPTFTAQLQLSFDIYDGGARAGAVTSAEGALEVLAANFRRTQLVVERDVSGALAQLITAERNVTAAEAGVDSAREGVRIAQGRYQVALGTLTDVLDAQASLVTARNNLATSLSEQDLARARLRHAVASPFEEGYFVQAPADLGPPDPPESAPPPQVEPPTVPPLDTPVPPPPPTLDDAGSSTSPSAAPGDPIPPR